MYNCRKMWLLQSWNDALLTFQDQTIFNGQLSMKLQNYRTSLGRSLTSSGQPAMIVYMSWFSTASSDVSRLTWSSRSVEKRTRSTRKSRAMFVTFSGLGNRNKPSASLFCEPDRCVIVKLYPCNWMTLKSRPYLYVWNRYIPNTI